MLLEPEERERRRLEERAAWTVKRIRGAGILTTYFGWCSTILFAVLSTGRQWHEVKALHELRPEASALQQRGSKPDRRHKHADRVIRSGSQVHRFVTLPSSMLHLSKTTWNRTG